MILFGAMVKRIVSRVALSVQDLLLSEKEVGKKSSPKLTPRSDHPRACRYCAAPLMS